MLITTIKLTRKKSLFEMSRALTEIKTNGIFIFLKIAI